MKETLALVVIAWMSLFAVHAKVLRWHDNPDEAGWQPARQTAINPLPTDDRSLAPTPTPTSQGLLHPRGASSRTLGYESGSSASARTCSSGHHMSVWPDLKAVDCCPDISATSCNPIRSCLPFSSATRYTAIGKGTLLCDEAPYTNCVKYTYADQSINGYTLWWCGLSSTAIRILMSATDTAPPTIPTQTNITSQKDASGGGGAIDATSPASTAGGGSTPGREESGPSAGMMAGAAVLGAALGLVFYRRRCRCEKGDKGDKGDEKAGPGGGGDGPQPHSAHLGAADGHTLAELEAASLSGRRRAGVWPGVPVAELPAEGSGRDGEAHRGGGGRE
ncbi:hypothetical protein RB595_003321 [Gaeumannomyces hyphopodioides]